MVGNSFKRSQWEIFLSGSTGFGYSLGRVAPRLGAVCDQTQNREPCPIADQSRHINELELLGALFTLQVFTAGSHDISVNIFLDNTTAVAYVNKCGGTHSQSLSEITDRIVRWCEDRKISILASHLPGNSNFIADQQLRTTLDSSNWMLLEEAFLRLANIWPIDFDLFASAWNAQHARFA